MKEKKLAALVVGDDASVRRLTVEALTTEGFDCDAAVDGSAALRRPEQSGYDAIIIELPGEDEPGQAVAMKLLQQKLRPIVVVVSAVMDSRLIKELFALGVDDIVCQPVEYALLGAKVKVMVESQRRPPAAHNSQRALDGRGRSAVDCAERRVEPISRAEIEGKLAPLLQLFPISPAALDVFYLARSSTSSAQHLAAAIQRDASLAAEVLRHANSSFYNPSGERILELQLAVARIGARRTGEIALASHALSKLTTQQLPWLNVEGSWRCSIAAGVAIELLLDQSEHHTWYEGLLLCSIMHGLGRVLLGTLYPSHYEQMVQACLDGNEPLVTQEQRMFPENHSKTAARLLESWNLPTDLYRPLEYILEPYESVSRLAEPLRSQVELVKVAVVLGQLAAGRWEQWDLIELPPANVVRRLRIHDVGLIVEKAAADVEEIIQFSANQQVRVERGEEASASGDGPAVRVAYDRVATEGFDFFAVILQLMGIRVGQHSLPQSTLPTLVNAIGAESPEVSCYLAQRETTGNVLLASDCSWRHGGWQAHESLALPCSWGAVRAACRRLEQAIV